MGKLCEQKQILITRWLELLDTSMGKLWYTHATIQHKLIPHSRQFPLSVWFNNYPARKTNTLNEERLATNRKDRISSPSFMAGAKPKAVVSNFHMQYQMLYFVEIWREAVISSKGGLCRTLTTFLSIRFAVALWPTNKRQVTWLTSAAGDGGGALPYGGLRGLLHWARVPFQT